ncbi:dual specificity protein phosphatase family protein [Natronosalvus amylolyticus]|uniref:dual specificity protein phosphatase family protein n=1 Tax=Natronosalvus amylolyticus TaxID=2961994 RepID=UPI0020C9E745|nr:dual specificity protein phosphatase [Natronosalvus amylolyticus]
MYEVSERLYYGGLEAAGTDLRRDIDHVIQLTYESPEAGYPDDVSVHTFSMMDGPRNDETVFCGAVSKAVELLEQEYTVLVHCSAGRSRSTCVTAAAYARHESVSFENAMARVREAGPVNAHEALLRRGKRAVAEGSE